MFSVRMEQLHSKRPTLNVQRPMLNSEGGSAAPSGDAQVCGCAAIINIEVAAATTARSTYFSTRGSAYALAYSESVREQAARQVTRISRISDQISSHKVHQDTKVLGYIATMKILSVNVGLPREVTWQGKLVTTGIFKEPVKGPVMLRTLNLDGDQQADLTVHGGVSKAVYVYPSEHYGYCELSCRSGFALGNVRRKFDNRGIA